MRINFKNNSLKCISIIIILFLVVLTKSCSDVKVLEEDINLNVENDNNVSITKVKDLFEDSKEIFKGYYIEDGKVYGKLYPGKIGTVEGDYDTPYTLDENGIFSKVQLKEPWSDEYKKLFGTNNFYKGIYTEGYPNTHEELKEKSYFIDIKKEKKFLLENHKKYENLIKENLNNVYKEVFLEGNFYLERHTNYFGFDKEFELYKEKEDRKNQFLLVDITNEKEYISDVMENMPYVFFYEKENSFMAINENGVIYKLVVNNEKIEKEEYSILPIKEYKLENLDGEIFTKFYKKNNFLVFNIMDDLGYKTLVIDIDTWEYKIHENINIVMDEGIDMDNSNLFITAKSDKDNIRNRIYYIEKINENLDFQVLGKLTEGENLYIGSALDSNENKAFITFKSLNHENTSNYLEEVEYFYINIKN